MLAPRRFSTAPPSALRALVAKKGTGEYCQLYTGHGHSHTLSPAKALLVARPLSPRSGGAEQTAVQAHRRLVLCAACRLACYVCNGWSEAVGTGMRQLARVWDIGMHDNSPGRTETMPKSGGIELIEIGELVCIRLKKTNVLTLQRLREVRERTECRSVN